MGAIIAYLNRNIPVVFAAFVIIVISYISAEISSLVAIPQLFFLIFFPRPMLVVCGLLICYIVFNNLLYICAKENYPIPLLNPKPSNRYAAFPVGRTSGRSMGSSAFIFASAASMIRICEAWRRSNSRRTEFSGMPSSFAEPDLGPAVPTHGLVDGKLRSHQRRENRPVGAGIAPSPAAAAGPTSCILPAPQSRNRAHSPAPLLWSRLRSVPQEFPENEQATIRWPAVPCCSGIQTP